MNTPVAVPVALQLLIKRNNETLQRTQQKLTHQVLSANEEMMRLLNLDPNDGWRLDMASMQYVRVPMQNSDIDTKDDASPIL